MEIIIRAKDEAKGVFAETEAASSGFASKLTKVGAVAGLALAGIGYESVKMAAKFDQSMELLVTQAGVAPGKLAGLKSAVLSLASQVGFSPDSLAQSLFHVASNMASMGTSTSRMMQVVKVAAEGAKVGQADLVDVTNALTSAVASGIPGVKSYGQAMGALNAIVGSGDMHMQDLAEAFSTGLLPVMKQYGLSLKDVGAALATFGDLNIRGMEAATKLRMAVQAMTAPTAQGKKDFAAMGMSFQQLADDIRHGGLMQGLTDLQEHYRRAGITGTKVGEALTVDFGKKAGVGLAVLLGNMDRLQSKYPAITKGANDFGKAWGDQQQQLAQQTADLLAGFDALVISIGEKLIPVVQKVIGWMLKHKQIVIDVAIALGVLAGALAAVSMAMTAISVLSNPFALIVIGVAALVAGVVYAYQHFRTFRDIVKDVAHFFVAVWDGAMHAAGAVTRWFTDGPLKWIRQQLAVVADFWDKHSKEIAQVTHVVWTLISDYVKVSLAIIKAVVTPFLEYMKTMFRVAWVIIRDIVRTVWSLIGQDIHMAIQFITGVIGIGLDLITGHWSKAWSDIKSLTRNMLADLVRIIKTAVSGFGHLLWDAGVALIKGLIGGITSMIGAAKNAIGSVVGAIKGFLPFSPAKEGPLSGQGDPVLAGARIGRMLSQGLYSSLPMITVAMQKVASAVAVWGLKGGPWNIPGYGWMLPRQVPGVNAPMPPAQVWPGGPVAGLGGGGGFYPGGTLQIVGGGDEITNFLALIIRRYVRVHGGGGTASVQRAFGQAWPAGA